MAADPPGSSKWMDQRDGASPAKPWLHPPEVVHHGVSFRVRYVGSLEVLTSMKSMAYNDRAQVAKECINRVCEAAGMKTPARKRKIDKRITEVLGLPNLLHAGEDVNLTVDTRKLEISSLSDDSIICSHELPDISFASGGDAETIDFIAYVGKNSERATSFPGRWCYVIECGAGVSQECVSTIGQAFDLRFKQFLNNGSSVSSLESAAAEVTKRSESESQRRAAELRDARQRAELNDRQFIRISGPEALRTTARQRAEENEREFVGITDPAVRGKAATPKPVRKEPSDSDYYNDMPGKKAPEAAEVMNSGIPVQNAPALPPPNARQRNEPRPLVISNRPESNLIDLHSPLENKARLDDIEFESLDPLLNNSIENTDPFDLTTINELLHPSLEAYPWFHGKISRQEAEHILKKDGDYLVRATSTQLPGSNSPPQQYALSGVYQGQKHHILLVDSDGVIRARDMTFESVPHLIETHSDTQEPILSGDDAIFLRRPIPRAKLF